MTEEKYLKAKRLRVKIGEVKTNLNNFNIESQNVVRGNKKQEPIESRIELILLDSHGKKRRSYMTLSEEQVQFLYNQELNRLKAALYKLEVEFSKL